jgi:NAD(P)-dependent dehydrogenase (short-subunit alcohol dehydrogenase family)
MRLNGKVAIVAGAGSEFGEAIARRYAEECARFITGACLEPDGGRCV